MAIDRVKVFSFGISILLHLLILSILPGLGDLRPVIKDKWLEVDLVKLPELETEVKTKPFSGKQTLRGTSQKNLPSGDSPAFPAPPVNLPSRLETFDISPPASSLTLPGALLPDIAGTGSTLPGFPTGEFMDFEKHGQSFSENPPDLDWQPGESVVDLQPNAETAPFPIQGPVSKRKVIYRPPPPAAVTVTSETVELKFWVHPDGTVGKIVPIVRADPSLEKAAMSFLKKWRFQTFPQGNQDQWGTISIRFKLR